MTVREPQPPHRPGERQRLVGALGLDEARQRGPQVVVVALQALQAHLLAAPEHLRGQLDGHRGVH